MDHLSIVVDNKELLNKSREEVCKILVSVESRKSKLDISPNAYTCNRELQLKNKIEEKNNIIKGCYIFLEEHKRGKNIELIINKCNTDKSKRIERYFNKLGRLNKLERIVNKVLPYPLNGRAIRIATKEFLIKEEPKPKEIKLTNLKELQIIL